MNRYLKNLGRIEFIITYDCTGKCKHCSEGEHPFSGVHIEKEAAVKAFYDIAEKHKIESVMTFGGEPLLYPEVTCAIHTAAKKSGTPKRQLITNGFFSKDEEKIKTVAKMICESGVNDLLLSVDAFHQETIPLEPVKLFAEELLRLSVPLRLSPAWLKSREDINPYNRRTREIIKEFKGAKEGEGNVIFPEGNALKYLREYFVDIENYKNPYAENPEDIRAVSIEPDGYLLGKSIYKENASDILEKYTYKKEK